MQPDDAITLTSLFSHSRKLYTGETLFYYPYGNATSKNILENYLGTPEIYTNVLFLGCGDIKSALYTASLRSPAFPGLHIHMNDISGSIIARDVLLTNILCAPDFDPKNPIDLQYLWDVWYTTQWDDLTTKRFLKDVDKLLMEQWHKNITIPKADDLLILKNIWSYWKATAHSMNAKTFSSILEQRKKFILHIWECRKSAGIVQSSTKSKFLDTVQELVEEFQHRMAIAECPDTLKPEVLKEFSYFFLTGNCAQIVANRVCINPTLLEMMTKQWMVHYLACPFEGYSPLPYKTLDPSDINSQSGGVVYQHCQSTLQDLVVQFRIRIKKTKFSFHIGDCLQICLFNSKLKNLFQVIDCSNLADHVGLGNLIPAARACLADDPCAVLLTEIMVWRTLKPTVAEYVEDILSCPLSMIPTLYGMRLANHVRLGNSIPINLFRVGQNFITLKWKRAPTYSSNIRTDISTALKTALDQLKKQCFLIKEEEPNRQSLMLMKRLTPMSYYYIIQSLLSRCAWVDSAVEFISQPTVSAPFKLAWRTQQEWLAGREVLQCWLTCPIAIFRKYMASGGNPPLRLLILPESESRKFMMKMSQTPVMPPEESYLKNYHYIDNIQLAVTKTLNGEPEKVSISFLLPKDHGLSEQTDCALLIDVSTSMMIIPWGWMWGFDKTKAKNPYPYEIKPMTSIPIANVDGFQLLKCIEEQNHYEMVISTQGLKIENTQEITISTDRKHPSDSAHQLTLLLENVAPLTIEVPWPFLVDNVKMTLLRSTPEKSFIKLVVDKSTNDPWPIEFGGRSKWDIDRLKRWDAANGMDDAEVKKHLAAQFTIKQLKSLIKGKLTNGKALDEVREIIKTIFMATLLENTYIFVIQDKRQMEKAPDFYLRTHTPLRISPVGAPLLLVSAMDHRMREHLLKKKAIDIEQAESDFDRIFTGAKNPEQARVIYTFTDEEYVLLRYLLRLNSTQMRATAWQSKNLPRGESWLPTFISPLYQEHLEHLDNLRGSSSAKKKSKKSTPAAANGCAHCNAVKDQMKRCARCKLVSYCDATCQKADWLMHKFNCSS